MTPNPPPKKKLPALFLRKCLLSDPNWFTINCYCQCACSAVSTCKKTLIFKFKLQNQVQLWNLLDLGISKHLFEAELRYIWFGRGSIWFSYQMEHYARRYIIDITHFKNLIGIRSFDRQSTFLVLLNSLSMHFHSISSSLFSWSSSYISF